MSRTISFYATIRFIEVEVFASGFDGDPSVGLEIAPEEIHAKRICTNTDFPLTDAEIEVFSRKAAELYHGSCEDDVI